MASSSSSSSSSSSIFCFFFLCSLAAANEVTVGGKKSSAGGWDLPHSSSYPLTKWAENARFKVGDFVVFRYEAGQDSVLQVTQDAYKSCNTSNPLSKYTDGNTNVKLDRSGPFYFISGENGHCEKGQKLSLVVVTPRYSAFSPAAAPSSVEFEDGPSLAPAPTSVAGKLGQGYAVLGLVLGLCVCI